MYDTSYILIMYSYYFFCQLPHRGFANPGPYPPPFPPYHRPNCSDRSYPDEGYYDHYGGYYPPYYWANEMEYDGDQEERAQ